MFKKRLALVVMCAMATGYRRAGVALEKGNNELEATEEQLTQFENDPHCLVIDVKESQDVGDVITHEDTLADLAGARVVVEDKNGNTTELDVSTSPAELHHWIAVIDDLNKEAPLTKKPNCDHLAVGVGGKLELTPSAAERDAAWEWYQNNVVIASTDSTDETGE